jgi:PGF-CTERM protein
VDDTYTKLVITVAEPLISINQIGDRHVGDKFNISGKTNLAVDDEILIEVYSSSFKPTQKIQSGEFSGTTGTVKVVKGEGGMNTFSLNVDTSTFKLDEYIVIAQSIVQDSTGTALFNMIEGASTNPVVTPPVVPVVTAPVVIVTAIPTVPPTAPPTAIPTTIVPTTTKSPGFGAVFALIGLGAVAFMVVRRE